MTTEKAVIFLLIFHSCASFADDQEINESSLSILTKLIGKLHITLSDLSNATLDAYKQLMGLNFLNDESTEGQDQRSGEIHITTDKSSGTTKKSYADVRLN